jgi:hypothetical protein
MTIKEKALKLAEYNGWEIQSSITSAKKGNEYTLKLDLFNIYSSFDKLMELFSEINSYSFEDLWIVNIDAFYVLLKHVNKGLVKQFEYNRNNTTLKEALIACLLKYYELTEGK